MKKTATIFLVFLVLLIISVFLIPSAFTACTRDSILCSAAWWLTQSGGVIGTAVILFIAASIYALRKDQTKDQILTFLKTLFILGSLIGIIAFVNEHLTKELIHQPRPSHIFLTNDNKIITIDSLYRVGTEKRRLLLKELTESKSPKIKDLDPKVLSHWVEEAGYSFPSGHSFNAFLLAVIVTWTMLHSRITFLHRIYWLPALWAFSVALSRVAIGAHSKWDVSFGAALGIGLAILFLHFDTTRKWITHR